ncbi:hypothetical protein NBRC110019_28200 [Neptunitalea chrysea]|uniref:N-acetyltransferase domain-containing protein n=1 Tax=Neptunitalea chrysea TaxID=1647581 RepID=A0A9W6EVG2_9FLAO|nr:hypothetical protein NBRC110019_28200 [Neptunitalea chrysea]
MILAIRLKPDNKFIEGIEQKFNRAEIGCWIAEPFWRKGYTTETTKSIIKFGFE